MVTHQRNGPTYGGIVSLSTESVPAVHQCFSVNEIVLVGFDERLYELCRHQTHIVALVAQHCCDGQDIFLTYYMKAGLSASLRG